MSDKFDMLGFSSVFFLNNMGTIVLGIAMIPLLGCVLLVLKPFSRFSRRIATFRNNMHASLFWSQQITLLNESYSMVVMCALINASHLTFDSKCEIVNSALTYTFTALSIVLPLIICTFLLVKLPALETSAMKNKYGELIEGLDLTRGRIVILTPMNFLIRRLILVVAVVYNHILSA